jgi:hypothetical protein
MQYAGRLKEWRTANIDRCKELCLKSRLKIAYGITPEEYKFMFDRQENRCAICSVHKEDADKTLVVDHAHNYSGNDPEYVRGILCERHNFLLGLFQDNIQAIKNAIEYLKNDNGEDPLELLESTKRMRESENAEKIKECPKCGERDLGKFGNDKHAPDGLSYVCRKCMRQGRKEVAERKKLGIVKENGKFCKKCGDRDPEHFHKGVETLCKKCRKKNRQEKREFTRDAIKQKFNMTLEQYDEILNKQGNKCFICSIGIEGIKRGSLDLDHNHRTGKVRKFLCSPCNIAIGIVNDDISLLQNAVDYLEKYKRMLEYGEIKTIEENKKRFKKKK